MERLQLLLILAWRNLWRHKRRTGIMLAAITIGTWMMLATAAFTVGMVNQQLDDAIKNLTGHIQIHHAKYRDDPSIEHIISMERQDLERRMEVKGIKQWAARVRVPAMVNSERDSSGVTLLGIELQNELGLSFIAEAVDEGRYLHGSDDDGIVIGARLAEKLETGLGKRIVIMTQDINNELVSRGFRIVGLYHADISSNELNFVFTGLATAQELLQLNGQVSEIAITVKDENELERITQSLNSRFPLQEVVNWKTMLAVLYSSFEIFDTVLLIWYLIIFLAMSFGIVNTILMAVYERTRELGLFQALGMQPREIILQIVLEAAILLGIGLAIGNFLVLLTLWGFADGIDLSAYARGMESFQLNSIVFLSLKFSDVFTANMLVIVLGIITSLYPARRAARLNPIEAILRS